MVHIAWNYADEDYKEEPGYIQGIQEIEKSILPVKEEFVMDDMEKLLERLMKHKRGHYPNDQRGVSPPIGLQNRRSHPLESGIKCLIRRRGNSAERL